MRRIGALTAAASAISMSLIAPANAAVSPTHLVGTASCTGGGTIRLATSLNEAGTAKAVAKVSGVTAKRWVGQVVAGVDRSVADDMTSSDAVNSTKRFLAEHGGFTTVGTRADATSANAVAYFLALGNARTGVSGSAECGAIVGSKGTAYLAADVFGREGLAVAAGPRAAVDARVVGVKGDRYRASFTVVGRGAPQHLSVERTAHERGLLNMVVRHVARLSAFSRVSLRVVDLTDRDAPPTTYSITR